MQRLAYRRGWWYHIARRPARKWTKLSQEKAEAERLWHRVEAGNGGTFAELIDRYLRLLPELGKADATVKEYRRQAEKLRSVFGQMAPRKIRPKHIGEYLDRSPHKVSANRDIALMSVICGYALRWGDIDSNPCLGIKRNKEKRRTRYLTPSELDAIRAAAGRLAPVVDLAYLTAARKSDLLALTWEHVLPPGLLIAVSKTKGNLLVQWSPRLEATISALAVEGKMGPTVIRKRDGGAYNSSGFDSVWQRIRDRSGVNDLHWHDIRGTALTDVERTQGVEAAKLLAAHANVSMTEAYVRRRSVIPALPAG